MDTGGVAGDLYFVLRSVVSPIECAQDPAAFLPPPKPKPTSRGWGKGTTDYSKWDAIDDSDDEERIVEIEDGMK